MFSIRKIEIRIELIVCSPPIRLSTNLPPCVRASQIGTLYMAIVTRIPWKRECGSSRLSPINWESEKQTCARRHCLPLYRKVLYLQAWMTNLCLAKESGIFVHTHISNYKQHTSEHWRSLSFNNEVPRAAYYNKAHSACADINKMCCSWFHWAICGWWNFKRACKVYDILKR